MIWLIGGKGMLGREVELLLRDRMPFVASDSEVDICDPDRLWSYVRHDLTGPVTHIVNCSAYTAVDRAEAEPEAAHAVNALGPLNLARIARELGAVLIHISTDYVFDGEKAEVYREDDPPRPLSSYGKSKLGGEEHIAGNCERFLILRTAWLYGRYRKNFVYTMLDLFQEKESIEVIADRWGNPTWAKDLAWAILCTLRTPAESGIYHFVNRGKANWHEFACRIYERARELHLVTRDVRIVPIPGARYPMPAPRPQNSCLATEKIQKKFKLDIRDWREALDEFLAEIAVEKTKIGGKS